MTMEGWHMGRKESAGRQAGTARMTVGDRFWARRIRPIPAEVVREGVQCRE